MVDLSNAFANMNQRYHVDMQSLTQALNRNIPPQPRQAYPMYTTTAIDAVPPPVYPAPAPQPISYQGPYGQRDNGYQQRDNGYQQRDNGYQQRDNGYQQRSNGYQPRQPWNGRDNGPPTRGTMFLPGECGFC